MKCPICNQEFSEPILLFHVERCKESEKARETPQGKKIEQMNKEELIAKAKELEIIIEDVNAIKKAEIIEMIKARETPQE